MAFLNCPECNTEVSDEEKICPICGKELKCSCKKPIIIALIAVGVIAAAVGIVFFLMKMNKDDEE